MERRDNLDDQVQAAAEGMQTELEKLEAHSESVGDHIDETRSEWEAKRRDPSVPGAEPREEAEAGGNMAGDWEGEGPAADEAGQ